MDTKLKKYSGRTTAYIISTVLFIVAASMVLCSSVALFMCYDLKYFTEKPLAVVDHNIAQLWWLIVLALVVAIVTLVISLVNVGIKDQQGKIKLNWLDKIFTDVQVVIGSFAFLGLAGMATFIRHVIIQNSVFKDMVNLLSKSQRAEYKEWLYISDQVFEPYAIEVLFTIVATVALMCILFLLSQSLVKKLKAGCFWRSTIIGKFLYYVFDAAQRSEGTFWKVMLVLLGGCLLSATWFGIIPVLIGIFMFVPREVRKYEEVKTGVEEVKKGNLSYNIPVTGKGELDRLATSINEISEATSVAVQNELKNQRLKTDLISNVSHDLKTPLTSMISYVDLLKTEGLDSENAEVYLKIIDEKTRRLQQLTEDLFEAAKASSGAIPVNMSRIEMTSIVNQSLAEMEAKLAENNLDVIFAQKTEQTYVMADGQLFWRVIENLLVNASKYALPSSRVYVDIIESNGGQVCLEVKNMSKEPLNISADELMERFKRGDESRNTEGSGLGLAIAKDLVKLMNGEFSLTIDGDLFKASVTLDRSEILD